MASGFGLPNTGSPVQLIYVVFGLVAGVVGLILTKMGLRTNDNHGVGPYRMD